MKTQKKVAPKTKTKTESNVNKKPDLGSDFFEILWDRSWTYIKTVVDVVREPMVILDKDFKVMAANEPFYETFKVSSKETEGESLYKLGNGQWKIPVLQKLLGDVLKDQTYFKGFQVAHEFPGIGRKVMILNARQIRIVHEGEIDGFPPIILLAMEDVTDMLVVAESLANHANRIETKLSERAQKLEITISKLEKDLRELQDKSN
ncbi:MAG: PAS/PAC sensor hybrid histidine kinase [Parcubacteria group bacterium GW2011_GWF2_44_8]|nr:MAG: PAS/PAC sensor hybrid histidine kinase [Parcubacteria group bacterium GW2011_GWF2_44_8]